MTMTEIQKPESSHFKGKDAIRHIAEVQAEGILDSVETHGAETPGSIFALLDANRETAFSVLLITFLMGKFELAQDQIFSTIIAFGVGYFFWKIGRGAWLSWSRFERLHRVVGEEKFEIEHHREQEREELKALYQAKGFQGKLLDDVVNVLMADGDRLLRVMLEEELGFRLEENEHPLVQGLAAGVGTMIAIVLALASFVLFDQIGIFVTCFFILGLSGYLSARYAKNRAIPAILWNCGLGFFSFVGTFCIMEYFSK